MSDPLVSIIVVNLNGKEHLKTCLDSILEIDYDNYEVILIDNNSTDGSVEFIREKYPFVIVKILDQNYGFAKPNNIGADMANGDLLLFLNNDTKVEKNFLTALVRTILSDPDIAICQSLLLNSDGSIDSGGDYVDVYGRAYSSKINPEKVTTILSARGASMLIRKNIFFELDKFDEMFFASFEDVDLGWRAWLWGYKVCLVPKSIVYHKGRTTISRLEDEIAFHAVKNFLILILTNFESIVSFRCFIMMVLAICMKKTFGLQIIKEHESMSHLPAFRNVLKAIRWLIANRSYISKKKKLVDSCRIVNTKQLMEKGLVTK